MKVNDLFEMSNIRKSESGLPVNIYVSSGGSINQQHDPRIKAMLDRGDKFSPHSTISILLKQNISPEDVIGYDQLQPAVLDAIRNYINLNYDVLLAYWNDEISTKEMILGLQSLT